MMEFPYPISEELLRVLKIRVVDVDYLGVGVSLVPFSTEHPPPMGHLFTRMISEPPSPPSSVEWVWIAAPLIGTVDALVLAFGAPLAVALALAPAVHTVVVGGGS